MRTIKWRIDNSTEVKLEFKIFGKKRFYVNEKLVSTTKLIPKSLEFDLPNGLRAKFERKTAFASSQLLLSVGGEPYVSNLEFSPINCSSCQTPSLPNEKFCSNCGAKQESSQGHFDRAKVRSAASIINLVGAIFILFGLVTYFMGQDEYDQALRSYEGMSDSDKIEQSQFEEVTTVGEMKMVLTLEKYSALVLNIILGLIMFILALWSKSNALAALLVAAAVYLMVQVLNFLVDPSSIGQGLIMKILIIVFLGNGIKAALSLRSKEKSLSKA
jgi:hypothetical protein